jgi:23S rRNA pseudouridine1911/1915/1917 synthase
MKSDDVCLLTTQATEHGTRYVGQVRHAGLAWCFCCYGLPAAGWLLVPRAGCTALLIKFLSRLLSGQARRSEWPSRGIYMTFQPPAGVHALVVPTWALPHGGVRSLWFIPFDRDHAPQQRVPPPEVTAAAWTSLKAVRRRLSRRLTASLDCGGVAGPAVMGTAQALANPSAGGPGWCDEYRCRVLRNGTVAGVLAQQARMPRGLRRQVARNGYLLLNGHPVTARHAAVAGDYLAVLLPAAASSVEPEAGQLTLLYEDRDLLVVNKASGVLTHPARGENHGTLANIVLGHLSRGGQGTTPRPVGRLDRGVSGLVVWARTRYAHGALASQRAAGLLVRDYIAVTGPPPIRDSSRSESSDSDSAVVSPPFDAARYREPRPAETSWKLLASWRGGRLMLVRPATGRTHQIRQHLAGAGQPLHGDSLYGGSCQGIERPALHAWRVRLRHPVEGRLLDIRAPLPADIKRLLAKLVRPSVTGARRAPGRRWQHLRPRIFSSRTIVAVRGEEVPS